MFFPERIKSIKDTDRVLEVGPGGTPHPRADVFLEKVFDEEEAMAQRGYTEELKTEKEIVFYNGNKFPFKDNEFDYVICSHVLEHISSDQIEYFIAEISRVAKRGYIEFPTIYYDYIYNFPEHLTFLMYENNTIKYIGKQDTPIKEFSSVHKLFYNSMIAGHTSIINSLKEYFFQGFEWKDEIKTKAVSSIDDVVYSDDISNNISSYIADKASILLRIKNIIKKYIKG